MSSGYIKMYADQDAWRKLISGVELSNEAQRWMKLDMLYPKLDEHEKMQESTWSCRFAQALEESSRGDNGLKMIDDKVEICRFMSSIIKVSISKRRLTLALSGHETFT